MNELAALAPAAPLHRVHAIKSPAANAWEFIQHSHSTAGGKEFWAAVVVVAILLVIFFVLRAARRGGGATA